MEEQNAKQQSDYLLSEYEHDSTKSRRGVFRRWLISHWLLCLILVLLIYDSIAITKRSIKNDTTEAKPYSPANSVVTYEKERFYDGENSLYGARPSEGVDEAWEELLTGLNIRATGEEMEMAGEDMNARVRLENGDYVAVLAVYHQLHCLDVLRRAIFPEYYLTNLTEVEAKGFFSQEHMGHCIEKLRRSVMCHADLTMYSAEWIADSHSFDNKRLRSNADAWCMNWDRIDAWARERSLNKGQFLVRPGPFETSKRVEG